MTSPYKLQVIEKRRKTKLSGRAFAASVGLNECMIRKWIKKEDVFRRLQESDAPIRVIRYVPRKKIGKFPQIDEAVNEWILQRNLRGIRVKDKFIQIRGAYEKDQLLQKTEDPVERARIKAFEASKIWCFRFKRRFGFVSRRHTTTHTMPVDFNEKAVDFIKEVQRKCKDYKIQLAHIINFDQVPRYYETDMSSTIAKKGSKEILLRKSSTSHKRFTFTPFITADGRILIKHALFSKLKNIPKHNPQCRVNVNATGMWNMEIMKREVEEAVKICRGLFDTRSNVLIILDSYAVHIQLVRDNEDYFKSKNVHFAIVPPRLTGLIQPLDVALNRSFQQHFNDMSDVYQEESLNADINKTVRGNIKMPSTELVTNWVIDWCDTISTEMISKAFRLCGLVPEENFDPDSLHQPLKDVFFKNLSLEEWLDQHGTAVNATRLTFDDTRTKFQGKRALLNAMNFVSGNEGESLKWTDNLIKDMFVNLQSDPLTAEIFDQNDKETIFDGSRLTRGFFEVYALAKMFETQIHIIEVDEKDEPISRHLFGHEFKDDIAAFFIQQNGLIVLVPIDYDPNDFLFTEIIREQREESENEDDEAFEGPVSPDGSDDDAPAEENNNEPDAYFLEEHLDDEENFA